MHSSTVEELVALGAELNANQYRLVCLAARYDTELDWFRLGFPNPAVAIAAVLDIHSSTAREWIRVGHALAGLPCIDEAFRTNCLSYAKARILTRWADDDNEEELLELARSRTASRLTAAIANYLAGSESEEERDQRHHDARSVSMYTDGDGMVVVRASLPPAIGKQVMAAIDAIVQEVAATPVEASAPVEVATPVKASAPVEVATPVEAATPVKAATPVEASGVERDLVSAAASPSLCVRDATVGGRNASAGGSDGPSMADRLRELKQRWQPDDGGGFCVPSVAQQRADALVLLFLGCGIDLVTEVVIHVRGDGATFDDGTPITDNAVCQRLDQSFIRMMVHDAERRPVNASSRRRHPTTRQKRVVLEAHNHECVDCQGTLFLELDHVPPFRQTRRTITSELVPRCAPCHRARHRLEREALTPTG